MLIEFRCENHRSIREEQALSMEAGRIGDDSDPRARSVPGHAEKLLTVAALYGANASGKSNVLSAFNFMTEAVSFSHRYWEPQERIPRNPFAWGGGPEQNSLFETTFLVGGVRFNYGFVCSDLEFVEEWLFAWPNGKKQEWFVRDGGNYKFGDSLRGENKFVAGITRPNALFLSTAVQTNHEQLTPIYSWFPAIRRVDPGANTAPIGDGLFQLMQLMNSDPGPYSQRTLFDEGAEENETKETLGRFRDLLRNADLGIVDVRLSREQSESGNRKERRSLELKHDSSDDGSWLRLEEESKGTQTIIRLAMPLISALNRGGVVLIDELESSLHPLLAMHIIRQFHEVRTNPHHAQLIFTTHDANLLGNTIGEPLLRRDQVWLTEKNSAGATVLFPLTDFKPRKTENLELGYLQGRYGAVPFLGGSGICIPQSVGQANNESS